MDALRAAVPRLKLERQDCDCIIHTGPHAVHMLEFDLNVEQAARREYEETVEPHRQAVEAARSMTNPYERFNAEARVAGLDQWYVNRQQAWLIAVHRILSDTSYRRFVAKAKEQVTS
jgi:hypothetical protein